MFPAVLCWMKITKINIYVVTYTHTKHTNTLSWYSETNSMSVRKCNTGVCRVKQSWMLETLSSNHSNKSSSPTGWRPTHPSTHTPTHCHHCLHTHTHTPHTHIHRLPDKPSSFICCHCPRLCLNVQLSHHTNITKFDRAALQGCFSRRFWGENTWLLPKSKHTVSQQLGY